MADAAVEFLLDNLKQLLLEHGKLISNAKGEVVKLDEDLRLFKAFLKDTVKQRRENEKLNELVGQIRDVVYEAEDIVDTFVTMAAEEKSMSYFNKWYKKPLTLHEIGKKVQSVSASVKRIYGNKDKLDFAMTDLNIADGTAEKNEDPIVREKNIVGFKEEAAELIGYLKTETQQQDVISIIGMPGLGKTTLAGMIYRSPEIIFEFPTRIWVYVSQEFSRKNVLLTILKEITDNATDDMSNQSDKKLAERVASYLRTGKFLIVLDDVWTAEDWKLLEEVLPTSNTMGKILITSRHVEVGNSANPFRNPFKLRFLTREESELLLQFEVFGKAGFPKELEGYAKLILDKCDELPLAIVVIGGILSKKVSAKEDVSTMETTWRKVSENVNLHMVTDDRTKRMEKIIALSYDKLPYHLRACFLYLGMFPEDAAIPAWELTRMWLAEGFIQRKDGTSFEEVAESYLEDLINWNLVRVDKVTRDGKVKTCRIHDMIRDFCKNEAGDKKENFLQEINMSREGVFDPPITEIQRFRRLCIHSNATKFVSSDPCGPHVRSFVYFSKEEINLTTETSSAIPAAFKLLRVLESKPIRLPKIPIDLFQLVHLRYINISFDSNVLPRAFSKFWNLQTLIVNTKHRSLEVKADIWKMKQLRHFKTDSSAALPKPEKGMESENIRTLGTISPQSCNEVVFGRARKVKKLGIRGNLAMFFSGKHGSFASLGKLSNLEKLKMKNDLFPVSASENPLPSLPPIYQFPPNLKSLTLADTFLQWTHMSVLGQLLNLKVLKLNHKAFVGELWRPVDGGFSELEALYICNTDLVAWVASNRHFPRLRSLQLKNCEHLHEVPIDLADIPTFNMLDLYRTSASAAASARKIQEKRGQMQEGTSKDSGFKLSIFPPAE